jgi:hypothetical protein
MTAFGVPVRCGTTSVIARRCWAWCSRVEEVLPFLLDTANELGLIVLDWAKALALADPGDSKNNNRENT